MKVTFVEVDRETLYLLPPSIQDWLPEKHPVRFVVEIVEQLDLQALEGKLLWPRLKAVQPGDAGGASVLRICHGSLFKSEAGAQCP
jgi:hypothetical protein